MCSVFIFNGLTIILCNKVNVKLEYIWNIKIYDRDYKTQTIASTIIQCNLLFDEVYGYRILKAFK